MAGENGARQKVDQGSRTESKSREAGRGGGHSRPQCHSTLLVRGGLGSHQAPKAKRPEWLWGPEWKKARKEFLSHQFSSSPLEIEAHVGNSWLPIGRGYPD